MNILVAGATGFIGRNLVPELAEKHYVKTLGRTKYSGDADKKITADLRNPEKYRESLEDIDVAYYLAHSLAGNSEFMEKEVEAAEKFVNACDEKDVERIVYLSGLQPQDEPSKHLESRRKVGEVLSSRKPGLTELRASIVIGEESVSFQMMYQLVENLPVIPFPGSMNSLSQPIALEDTIHYLVEVLESEDTAGETYDIGGSDVLRYREMMEILAEEIGVERRFLSAPDLPVKMYSFWMRFFTDIDPRLAHSLMESLKHDLVVEREIESDHHSMGFRESVREVIGT